LSRMPKLNQKDAKIRTISLSKQPFLQPCCSTPSKLRLQNRIRSATPFVIGGRCLPLG